MEENTVISVMFENRRPALRGALLAVALLGIAPSALAVETSGRSGFGIDAWWGEGDERASQVYVPLEAELQSGEFAAGLATAYVYTSRNAGPEGDATLGTLVDTKLTTSYTVVDRFPVDLLLGLDFNLPTGETKLDRKELSLLMDPDLVSITTFGEGFNVNPLVTVAHSWGPVAAGVGMGYLWRGSYDLGADSGGQDYDPGDVFDLTGEVHWAFAPEWKARLLASYARYGTDELDGEKVREEGTFFGLLAGVRRQWERWDASVTAEALFRGKSRSLDENGSLATDPERSRGTEWKAIAATEYALNRATRIGATAAALYVAENGYSDSSTAHVGSRRKLGLTAGLWRRLAPAWEARVELGGFYLHAADSNDPWAMEEGTYRGTTGSVVITAHF